MCVSAHVGATQGREKPKFTSFQLIILSASQPIGLYYLFTLYRCASERLCIMCIMCLYTCKRVCDDRKTNLRCNEDRDRLGGRRSRMAMSDSASSAVSF